LDLLQFAAWCWQHDRRLFDARRVVIEHAPAAHIRRPRIDDESHLDRNELGAVRRVARPAEIGKRVGPHTLRHAFITAALDAGVPLRDVQEAASLADPRTTMRYDRGRQSLDRHATFIVATFVAGASR